MRVINMHTLKPLDKEAVLKAAEETNAVVTVEEHSIIGGLGSAVAEVLAEAGTPVAFKRVGIDDAFSFAVGSQAYHLKKHGISVPNISDLVMKLVNQHRG